MLLSDPLLCYYHILDDKFINLTFIGRYLQCLSFLDLTFIRRYIHWMSLGFLYSFYYLSDNMFIKCFLFIVHSLNDYYSLYIHRMILIHCTIHSLLWHSLDGTYLAIHRIIPSSIFIKQYIIWHLFIQWSFYQHSSPPRINPIREP